MRRRHSISGVNYMPVKGSASQTEWVPVMGPALAPVKCNVHPLDTAEIQFYGEQSRDMRKVFADSWPFDTHSRLTFQGSEWDQVEPEKDHDLGERTKHHEIIIRKR